MKYFNQWRKADMEITPYTSKDMIRDYQGILSGLKTGYEKLDKFVRIPVGAITIIAGLPSHGKTTMLLNLTLNIVEEYKRPILFFSYEEPKGKLYGKMVNITRWYVAGDKSFPDIKDFRDLESYVSKGRNDIEEVTTARKLLKERIGRFLYLNDEHPDINKLEKYIYHAKQNLNPCAVFIDCFQRITTKDKFQVGQWELQKISQKLSKIAVKTGIPIIAGAQRGRGDVLLRGAADIENDANLVINVYNEVVDYLQSRDDENNRRGKANRAKDWVDNEIIPLKLTILKYRDGAPQTDIYLDFNRPFLAIKDPKNNW